MAYYESLRQRAEAEIPPLAESPGPLTPDEALKIIHELRVHQVELEMQNEHLRQVQRELEESRSRYADLYDFAPVGILTLDQFGVILEANLTAAAQLGTQRERLLRSPLKGYLNSRDRKRWLTHLHKIFAGPGRQTFEARVISKEGGQLSVLLESIVVESAGGKKIVRLAITDITARQQAAAAELKVKLAQAHKMEAIGTLVGGIAHDFNNILCAIMGSAELTLLSLAEGSKGYQNLERILKASERAKDLVGQILTFCRKSYQEKKPLQISLVVKEALRLLRATIPTTIEIKPKITAPEAMVLADSTQMHQIIINLGVNAAQAMQEHGGALTVRLAEKHLDKKALLGYPDLSPGPYVILTVSDTGHGIAPENIDRIFAPFFTTKEVGEGTGMGLAVVYGIVKAHGGGIAVASQPGSGASFTIVMPKIAGPEGERQTVIAAVPRGHGRILVIDDEKILVDLIKEVLEILGYEVTAANSSLEAWNVYQAQPDNFDLIITDQIMPDLTGLELSRKVRRLRPDIPIIFFTGHSDKVIPETFEAAGIDEVLMKPMSLLDLGEAVFKVLNKKELE